MESVQAEVMVQLHVRAKDLKLIVHDMTAGCLANVWQPMEKHNKINISLHTVQLQTFPFICACVLLN